MIKVAVTPTAPYKKRPTIIIAKFLNIQKMVARTQMVYIRIRLRRRPEVMIILPKTLPIISPQVIEAFMTVFQKVSSSSDQSKKT